MEICCCLQGRQTSAAKPSYLSRGRIGSPLTGPNRHLAVFHNPAAIQRCRKQP